MRQIARLVGAHGKLRVSAAVHAALVDVCRALDHVLHQQKPSEK